MAKTLISGQTVESMYGDVWDAAILSIDQIQLDYLNQIMKFRVDIYKDATERTEGSRAVQEWHVIDKTTFLAEFNISQPVTTLKSQCEDYALTLIDPNDPDGLALLYGSTFE